LFRRLRGNLRVRWLDRCNDRSDGFRVRRQGARIRQRNGSDRRKDHVGTDDYLAGENCGISLQRLGFWLGCQLRFRWGNRRFDRRPCRLLAATQNALEKTTDEITGAWRLLAFSPLVSVAAGKSADHAREKIFKLLAGALANALLQGIAQTFCAAAEVAEAIAELRPSLQCLLRIGKDVAHVRIDAGL